MEQQDLKEQQQALNEQMVTKGKERFRNTTKRALEAGRLSTGKSGNVLLSRAISSSIAALKLWMKTKEVTRFVPIKAKLKDLCTTEPALTRLVTEASRVIINSLVQDVKYVVLCSNIGKAIEDECMIREYKKKHKIKYREASRRIPSARPERRRPILRRFAYRNPDFSWTPWGSKTRVMMGMLFVAFFEEAKFIEINTIMVGPKKFTKYVKGTKEVMTWLAEADGKFEDKSPLYMPMLEPPADWDNLFEGGYPDQVFRKPLVKVDVSKHRSLLAKEHMPLFYEAVNNLQSVAYRVNENVLQTALHFWQQGTPIAGLPRTEPEEIPPFPAEAETDKDLKIKWKREASKIHHRNALSSQKRIAVSNILNMGKMYSGKDFYYPYRSDFRGRLYTLPQYLTFQSEDLARGSILFADSAPIKTEEDAKWLWIHGANVWGRDKLTLEDRVKWCKEHAPLFRAISSDPLGVKDWADADKPWQALAFCFEIDAYLQAKEAGETFQTHLPIWIDGSNNGLQLFSLLIRDEVGGKATNVTPNETPEDIYQTVANIVIEKLKIEPEPKHKEKAEFWLKFGINRKTTKKVVMTVPYGVSPHSAKNYTQEWYEDTCVSKSLEQLTPGLSFQYCAYLSNVILESINEVVIGAKSAMKWLRETAGILTKNKIELKWTTPSGFVVRQACEKTTSSLVVMSYGDKVHRVMVGDHTGELSRKGQVNGISPNFIHSLDAAILHLMVNKCFNNGIYSIATIHDSFGFLSPMVDTGSKLLSQVVKEVFSENLLLKLKREIQSEVKVLLNPPPTMGNLNIDEVTQSKYLYS